ncbi:MAG: hypothetical protein HY893_05695 [Deltaproteobacteria bacterium]|nr:hypothetical protein [Deltaproteobacteria bacterium]
MRTVALLLVLALFSPVLRPLANAFSGGKAGVCALSSRHDCRHGKSCKLKDASAKKVCGLHGQHGNGHKNGQKCGAFFECGGKDDPLDMTAGAEMPFLVDMATPLTLQTFEPLLEKGPVTYDSVFLKTPDKPPAATSQLKS